MNPKLRLWLFVIAGAALGTCVGVQIANESYGWATVLALVACWIMAPGSTKGLLFETDTLDEDVESIRAQGVVVSDINEEAWGRYASLDDPDGNGIVLRGAVSPH